ncbi:sporulation protein YpjB [Heyndrickxia sporothermodurans]|nr:sporulation protein YpjB [Heyndrickxia sporothermodurans]
MKIRVIILLILFFGLFLNHTFVNAASPMEKLDKLADEALQLTTLGHDENAKNSLDLFINDFTEMTSNSQFFSMDDIKILLVSHKEAKKAIESSTISTEEKIDKVLSFRLVVDAMNSHYQPLWTELQNPIMTAFSQLKEAVKENDADSYQVILNRFLTQYLLIQPSMKIDVPVDKFQRLDAQISFIDKYRSKIILNDSGLVKLDELEADLQHVFNEMSEDESDPSLWLVIITTGSIIILALSYVGWRKYRGEKYTKQKEHND